MSAAAVQKLSASRDDPRVSSTADGPVVTPALELKNLDRYARSLESFLIKASKGAGRTEKRELAYKKKFKNSRSCRRLRKTGR